MGFWPPEEKTIQGQCTRTDHLEILQCKFARSIKEIMLLTCTTTASACPCLAVGDSYQQSHLEKENVSKTEIWHQAPLPTTCILRDNIKASMSSHNLIDMNLKKGRLSKYSPINIAKRNICSKTLVTLAPPSPAPEGVQGRDFGRMSPSK